MIAKQQLDEKDDVVLNGSKLTLVETPTFKCISLANRHEKTMEVHDDEGTRMSKVMLYRREKPHDGSK